MKILCGHKSQFLTRVTCLLLVMIVLNACGTSNRTTSSSNTANHTTGCKQVGVLLPDTASSDRWQAKDRPLLNSAITHALPGVKVDIVNAEGNATTQQNQADQALTRGDCILVVAAVDSDQASAIVKNASQQNVPVIAYDRLIQNKHLKCYVSFDNKHVGELQGQYIADHYQDYMQQGQANLVMLNGSQTDNNALLFNQGAMNKLKPLIIAHKINKIYDIFVPDWNNDRARTAMEQALTANQNNIQLVYAANDGLANAAIAALRAQKLNGKVLVTGQDSTMAGIQNILTGNQSMTVYKAITQEATATAQLVAALSRNSNTATLTQGDTTKTQDGTAIPSILETPVIVTKDTIKNTILNDHYMTKEQICQNLPPNTDTQGIC
ncbi:sugar ABC transporter substrate-binding protein [Dictyobacter arantiisoli]|uniref:Sugar ABC transporter substrate-binding protein n=1 Tax=Dictyobacter arantiisoli TaxID=2014874 RepID=A0A5A5TH60_9CHLR|nr:substrate-binding domain-containing protein [Dictyobacter arantiisoli]GCF10575.1 sugar ABC transporter substrate-binding protein [Dictyobacter arantiisoli]